MTNGRIAFIQARMGSARLPGKMTLDLAGRLVLERTLDRVRRASLVDDTVLLTTTSPQDDVLEELGRSLGVSVFRGEETDVVARYYRATAEFDAEVCIRITGDCPLHDPKIIDVVISDYIAEPCDYAANLFRYTWPEGTDVEVISRSALERVFIESKEPSAREHVGLYMARHPTRFSLRNVACPEGDYSNWHWSVDTPEDLSLIRQIYERLGGQDDFTWMDVVALCESDESFSDMWRPCSVLNPGLLKSLREDPPDRTDPKVQLVNRSVQSSVDHLSLALDVIPGASQTFSKQYTQYVLGTSPLFLERSDGCRVWDLDGNEYVDYVMGLLPVILGHAHPSTVESVSRQVKEGISFSLPIRLESEVAAMMIDRIPCAEMVRFGKNGSDATAGAVRVARAFTGRDRVACCGYHGWQDWYIGSTTRGLGVPDSVRDLTLSFDYNNLESLLALFANHVDEIACVIMEPIGIVDPQEGFLAAVRDICHANGALLIFDEIITGFRTARGGAQEYFSVTPDLAAFGKGMANGLPISAVVGRRDVMMLFDEIFFSFTFGGEALSLAATKATLEVLDREDVVGHLWEQGTRLRDGYNALARACGLQGVTQCLGLPPHTVMTWRDPAGQDWLELKTLFLQETAKRGILSLGCHNLSLSHSTEDIYKTLLVYEDIMPILGAAVESGEVANFLEGPCVTPVFRQL